MFGKKTEWGKKWMRKKIKEVGGVTGHLERNRHRGLLLLSPFSLQGEKTLWISRKKEKGGEPPFFSLSSPCALSSVSSSILRKFFPLGKKRQQAFLEIIFFSCCLTLGFCQVRHTSACFVLFWRRRANNTCKKRFSQVQQVAHKEGTQGGGSK